ncbi:Enc1, partial [Symbiodinium sp. KB8]
APTILDNGFQDTLLAPTLDEGRVPDGYLRGDACNCEPQVGEEMGSQVTARCEYLTYWESTGECRIYRDCNWVLCQNDFCFESNTYRNAPLGEYLTLRGYVQVKDCVYQAIRNSQVCAPNLYAMDAFPLQVWGAELQCVNAVCEIVPAWMCYERSTGWVEWPLNADLSVNSGKLPDLASTNVNDATARQFRTKNKLGYGRETLVIDGSNVGDSSKHSGQIIPGYMELDKDLQQRPDTAMRAYPEAMPMRYNLEKEFLLYVVSDPIDLELAQLTSCYRGTRGVQTHSATLWLDLDGFQNGGAVIIYWKEPASDYTVQVSLDNITWWTIIEVTGNQAFFGANYLQLRMTRAAATRGPGIDEGKPVFSIYEIEVERDTNVARLQKTTVYNYFNKLLWPSQHLCNMEVSVTRDTITGTVPLVPATSAVDGDYAEQLGGRIEMSGATATTEEISDVVLHFGVDSMPANSALLRLASPVFNRMFTSGMKEAQQGVIEVDVASKKDFITFYNLLGPWSWNRDKVTEANVDSLLEISDYYQVEIIKQTCEDLMLTLPPTGARLLQAKKHDLNRQYLRCIDAMAKRSTRNDLEMLRQSEPDILLDVAIKKQHMLNQLMGLKPEISICKTCVTHTLPHSQEYCCMLKSKVDQLKNLHGKLHDLVQELENTPKVSAGHEKMQLTMAVMMLLLMTTTAVKMFKETYWATPLSTYAAEFQLDLGQSYLVQVDLNYPVSLTDAVSASDGRPEQLYLSITAALVLDEFELTNNWEGRCFVVLIEETLAYFGENYVGIREIATCLKELYTDSDDLATNGTVNQTFPGQDPEAPNALPEVLYLPPLTADPKQSESHLTNASFCIDGDPTTYFLLQPHQEPTKGRQLPVPFILSMTANMGVMSIEIRFAQFGGNTYFASRFTILMGVTHFDFDMKVSDNLALRSGVTVDATSSWDFNTWFGAMYGLTDFANAYLQVKFQTLTLVDVVALRWKYPASEGLCSSSEDGEDFATVGAVERNSPSVIAIREMEVYATTTDITLNMPVEAAPRLGVSGSFLTGLLRDRRRNRLDIAFIVRDFPDDPSRPLGELRIDTMDNFTAWGVRILSPSTSVIDSFHIQVSDDSVDYETVYDIQAWGRDFLVLQHPSFRL